MGSYEENESTYSGMKIAKVNNENPDGVISEPNKYDDWVNHIVISHERTRTPKEPLAEAAQAIFRSELGELLRIARFARHGAIRDASADAKTFPGGKLMDVLEKGGGFWRMEEMEFRKVGSRFRTHACFRQNHGCVCVWGDQKDVNKANLLKIIRKLATRKRTIRNLTVQNWIFLKRRFVSWEGRFLRNQVSNCGLGRV